MSTTKLPKIAFFDIDGTLKVHGKIGISHKTLYMLKALKAQGVKICIATGRSPITLPVFEGIEFDAWMTFNGSYIFAGPETVFSRPIPHEDVLQIVRNADALNRPVVLATRDLLIANGTDEDLVEYFALASLEVEVSPQFEAVLQQEVFQIMAGSCEEEHEALMQAAPNAKITTWWPRGVDIIPAATGKGVGVAALLKYYGLSREDSIAFGDGGNDMELLAAAGTAVAMENACEELKAIADELCGHVERDGIYHYCVNKGYIASME